MKTLISEVATVIFIAAILQTLNYFVPVSSDPNLSLYDPSSIYDTEPLDIVIELPIDLNLATKNELMALKGIGEKTADKIIEYRRSQYFIVDHQIMNISGIGMSTYQKIKEDICVDLDSIGLQLTD